MGHHQVIIELSPSRIEVAIRRGGHVIEWRTERFARTDWPQGAEDPLSDALAPLSRITGEMSLAGCPATVIYDTPGSVASLTSCAASVGAAGATQAALLAVANVADFPVDDAPTDTCVLLTDTAAGDKKSANGQARQTHILAAADAEHRGANIAALVQAAGLTIERLIPADAIAMAEAIRVATADRADDQVVAAIFFGEHSTILAAGLPNRLLFVRTTATGTESLAEALTRPLRPRDPNLPALSLPHDQARTVLLAVGVPTPEAEIPSYPTLAGASLLPHLQPILQRLAIEIKQSLRFGVPESDRPRTRIVAAGPGAAVPGLADAIARLSGFPVSTSSTDLPEPDGIDSATGGLIAALTRCPHVSIALMPTEVRKQANHRRMRRALLTGVGASALFIGYAAVDAHVGLASAKAKLAALKQQAEQQRVAGQVREEAFASRQALAGVESRVRKHMGESPDFSAAFSVLSEKTPPTIRLTNIELMRDAANGRLTIRGYTRVSDSADPAGTIRGYVNELSAFPIVDSVRLGATHRSQQNGHDAQAFDLTVSLVALPPEGIPGPVQPQPHPAPGARPLAAAETESAK